MLFRKSLQGTSSQKREVGYLSLFFGFLPLEAAEGIRGPTKEVGSLPYSFAEACRAPRRKRERYATSFSWQSAPFLCWAFSRWGTLCTRRQSAAKASRRRCRLDRQPLMMESFSTTTRTTKWKISWQTFLQQEERGRVILLYMRCIMHAELRISRDLV